MLKLINRFLFRWPRLLLVILMLALCLGTAFAGGLNPGQSTNALTVQGMAPGAASGLATLDLSSKVTQTAIKADSLTMQGEYTVAAGGAITVTTSATTLYTTASITVTAGDRILALGTAIMTKGATAGADEILFSTLGGTATASLMLGTGVVKFYAAAGETTWTPIFGIYDITGSGLLVSRLYAKSFGSDSTSASGSGFYVFLKKQ